MTRVDERMVAQARTRVRSWFRGEVIRAIKTRNPKPHKYVPQTRTLSQIALTPARLDLPVYVDYTKRKRR
jgi:hypothetical protein